MMPSSEEWIMGMGLIYTVEYYLDIKRKEIMEFVELDETRKKTERSKLYDRYNWV